MNWIKEHANSLVTLCCLLFLILGLLWRDMATFWFALSIIVGGYRACKEAYLDLVKEHQLNVDLLMVLAALGAAAIGEWREAAALIFIFSLAETLEDMAMEKSRQSIAELLNLSPDQALRYLPNGEVEEVLVSDLSIGDRLRIRKGDAVAIDGILLSSVATLDESMVSGEPLPVEKVTGDVVIGGTINQAEGFDMEVTVASEDTLLAKIVNQVSQAQEQKSKASSLIDRIENRYVRLVLIVVPLFIILGHFLLAWDWMTAFYRGMILLTVASPCALIASATPATLTMLSKGARNGLLIKGGDIADRIGNLDVLVVDKTGTLTEGHPSVSQARFWGDSSFINSLVGAAEKDSTHPIAQALTAYTADAQPLVYDRLEDLTGHGLRVTHQGQDWLIGKKPFILEHLTAPLPEDALSWSEEAESIGQTLVWVAAQGQLQAIYGLEDAIKPTSYDLVKKLHQLGIKVIMATGDQERTAQHVADELGLDGIYANCLPNEKVDIIQKLKEDYQTVGMVGDGINDAPALTLADIAYAVGNGTDIAIESADIVVRDDLKRIPFSVGLSRQMTKIVKQNIIFSLNVIILLILANLLEVLNLPLGVIGHEGSTILVILNGLRLLFYRLE